MELDDSFRLAKWETFPCGHKVRDLVEFNEVVLDLQAFHGVDARKEVEEIHEAERQTHLTGTCKEPQNECSIISRAEFDSERSQGGPPVRLRFFLVKNGVEVQELGVKP